MLKSLSHNSIAISFMLCATFLFSVISLVLNKLSSELNIILVMSLSTWVSAIIMWGRAIITKGKIVPHKISLKIYITRACCSAFGAIFWVQVLRIIPVTEATAISYTTPLFNIIFAILLLKERISTTKMVAVIIALAGVMLVLRPAFTDLNPGYLLALINTILWVAADLLTKAQAKTDRVSTQCLYLFTLMAVVQTPFIFYYWQIPTATDLFWILVVGILQLFNIYTLFKSYKLADMVIVAPFDCGRLVFTMGSAYLIYGETLNIISLIGALIIVSCLIYLLRTSKVKNSIS